MDVKYKRLKHLSMMERTLTLVKKKRGGPYFTPKRTQTWMYYYFNHFSVKIKIWKDNLFLNLAFEIKNALQGRIILVSFYVFLSLSKMIPNEFPDRIETRIYRPRLFIPVKCHRQEQQQIKVNL